jgi:hypothetical protein
MHAISAANMTARDGSRRGDANTAARLCRSTEENGDHRCGSVPTETTTR